MRANIKVVSPFGKTIIEADNEQNIFTLNGQDVEHMDVQDFLVRLSLLSFSWKGSMRGKHILDEEYYQINLIDGKIDRDFSFRGAYPKNFNDFLSLLSEVRDD